MSRSFVSLALFLAAKNASAESLPDGWLLTGGNPQSYVVTPDRMEYIEGRASAHLSSRGENQTGFGTLAQAARAEAFRGERVRFSAYIKAKDVTDWAGLWFRADRGDGALVAFDNMANRPIKASSEWQPYEIVLELPAQTDTIAYGVLINGSGSVWFDDARLEIVDRSVHVTQATEGIRSKKPMSASVIQPSPINLNVESWAMVQQGAPDDGSAAPGL
ncbi:hypothetical protein [Hydrocarboniphaga sp.]|uniref:hypothetical protein n=1 Tax=Hydrocarboniphaga sp. TaxID=2033016 RepID=UPI003D120A29